MNTAYFIARRISCSASSDFSHTAHRFAVASLAIGLAASIVAILIMRGFQHTVEEKIYRFSGHIIISKLTVSNAIEGAPFSFNLDLGRRSQHSPYRYVTHVEEVAYKAGLIRTRREALGILFKGVGPRFDRSSFRDYLVEGALPTFADSTYSQTVVISRAIADKLDARVGDNFVVYFFQNPPRARKLRIAGIYETDLSEYFDSKVILGDLRLVRRLNNWPDSVASGLEVHLADARHVDETYRAMSEQAPYDLHVEKAREKYADVFEWLALIGRQVNLLLAVIFIVICINLIAIVLILVVERTRMVGVLQAMGASPGLIRSVFFYSGLRLTLKGVLWGNLIGLLLCLIQDRFQLIRLNPQDYYMRFVPIYWDWPAVLAVNLVMPLVASLAILVPAVMAGRTDPIKAIRFA